LVEIGVLHQIRWNILREHNWGVHSVHIKFIYYDTYIVHYLIVLWGHAHNTKITCMRIIFPTVSLKAFGVAFWPQRVEINKEK